MANQRLIARLLIGAILFGAAWGSFELTRGEAPALQGDDKKEKKPPEKRGGTIIGILTEKGKGYIEVKADGEEKARRYVPHWVGGAPAQGGGPDKKMLEVFNKLKVGSRIRLVWEFEERPRAVRIEVLKGPDGKEVEKDKNQ